MPKAEVLLPLPLPVRTTSSPRSSVATAIAASTSAFLRAMRATWRALRSGSLMRSFRSSSAEAVFGAQPSVAPRQRIRRIEIRHETAAHRVGVARLVEHVVDRGAQHPVAGAVLDPRIDHSVGWNPHAQRVRLVVVHVLAARVIRAGAEPGRFARLPG